MSVGWDQTFAFDRSALSSTLRAIGREPGLSTRERFDQLPFGKNKVEGYLAYLDRLGLFDRDARAPSPLGDILVREDPGWQEPGTWALLQLLMSSEPTATVWYEMTHEVLPHAAVFTKEEAEEALLRRPGVLEGSLDNARGDLGRYIRALTEESALGGLRLLSAIELPAETRYRRAASAGVPPLILAFGLYAQRARSAPDARSMALSAVMGPGGAGRAFHLHLDPDAFADLVAPLRAHDILGYTRTAGLQDVEFLRPQADPLDFVVAYYEGLA